MTFVQLIDASGATQRTGAPAALHDGLPEHVIPQKSVARKSTPLSHDLSPAQFAMQTVASHWIGADLHDSPMHWNSQRPDWHDTPLLHVIDPVQLSVHERPPVHFTPSQLFPTLQSTVQSFPGGQASVCALQDVAVQANVQVPVVALQVPPAVVHAAGSQTLPAASSVGPPSVPVLESPPSGWPWPSPLGASPASLPTTLPPSRISSRSSIPSTAAHAATAATAPQSMAKRPARATTCERVRFTTGEILAWSRR